MEKYQLFYGIYYTGLDCVIFGLLFCVCFYLNLQKLSYFYIGYNIYYLNIFIYFVCFYNIIGVIVVDYLLLNLVCFCGLCNINVSLLQLYKVYIVKKVLNIGIIKSKLIVIRMRIIFVIFIGENNIMCLNNKDK